MKFEDYVDMIDGIEKREDEEIFNLLRERLNLDKLDE